jgi:hypothetical protein
MGDGFMLRPQLMYAGSGLEEDASVFYGMDVEPASTACIQGQAWNDECFKSWSWDRTACTDLVPFSVGGMKASGVFMQLSADAMAEGVSVGNAVSLTFGKCNGAGQCQYLFRVHASGSTDKVLYEEVGLYNWTRATRSSPTDSRPAHNTMATCAFSPVSVATEYVRPWDSLWIARSRYSGSFQSPWGIASFELEPIKS